MKSISNQLSYWKHKLAKIKTPYSLHRVDGGEIPENPNEIRLFAIARNESLRLEHFIEYYQKKGVDRIIIIDNDSSDNTIDIALSYENVHVFSTKKPYRGHWYWMEFLLKKYGLNHWCLVVDIDELIYYPNAETLSLRDLTAFLSENDKTAIRFLLLDMYSDKKINETRYLPGQNPLEVCPYFDKEYRVTRWKFFDRKNWEIFESIDFRGGMRERVFGSNLPYRLPKISLFKNLPNTYLTDGMHALNRAVFSELQGVVFHTKFLFDFIEEVEVESIREEHFGNAILYKIFNDKLQSNSDLKLIFPGSQKFKDAKQLVELGVMKSTPNFDKWVKGNSTQLMKA